MAGSREHCHPLDITHGRGKVLFFHPNHWADGVARTVAAALSRLQEGEPVGYASTDGLEKLAKSGHHHYLSVSKTHENEFVRPLYTTPPTQDSVAGWLPIENGSKLHG